LRPALKKQPVAATPPSLPAPASSGGEGTAATEKK